MYVLVPQSNATHRTLGRGTGKVGACGVMKMLTELKVDMRGVGERAEYRSLLKAKHVMVVGGLWVRMIH